VSADIISLHGGTEGCSLMATDIQEFRTRCEIPSAGFLRPVLAEPPRVRPPMGEDAGSLFGAEVVTLYPRLVRYAQSLKRGREGVEDLAQDTVCRALEKRHFYRSGTNLIRWLTRIMLGIYIDEVRRTRRRNVHVELTEFNTPSLKPSQEPVARAHEVIRAVNRINRRYRRVVELSLLEMTNEAISRELSIPYGTVLSRLSRGRQDLMRQIEVRT
jgi:RNA polymerase sigma-70 factor, ECF subfamily